MSRPIPIEEMVRLFKIRHTTSHLFKIDNFSLLKKHGIEKVESSVFDLAGHKWKLSVYPNGHKNAKGTHVSMFLVNQVPVNDMPTYELLVVSQLERKWHTHGRDEFDINPEPASEGFLRFISLADLERKGFLIGDCCMFGVKFHGIEPANPGTAECFSLIEKPLNHKVTWMMSKFSSFNPGKAHQSNEFVVGTRKWRLEVHPRGYMDEKDKSFSVYLSAEGFVNNAPMTKTYAKFKLRAYMHSFANSKKKNRSLLCIVRKILMESHRVFVATFMLILHLVQAQDQPGFINVDCGLLPRDSPYNALGTGLVYTSDVGLVSSGKTGKIAKEFEENNSTPNLTLRYFPDGARNCYNLNVSRDTNYMIKATFVYGNYDGHKDEPNFDLYLGPNLWATVSRSETVEEIIHVTKSDSLQVCLAKTGDFIPFINILELRPLKKNVYVTESGSLKLLFRKYFSDSGQTIRYPDDIYDRVWHASFLENNWAQVSTTLGVNVTDNYDLSQDVMATGATPLNDSETLNITWNVEPPTTKVYSYMHFAELETLRANDTREFNVMLNGNDLFGPYSPIPLKTETETNLKPEECEDGACILQLVKTSKSTLPPLLNAIEAFTVIDFLQVETDEDDAAAIKNVQNAYGLINRSSWQGDPCVPKQYSWDGLKCSYSDSTPPIINFLDLSASGLTGIIAPAIQNLTHLEILALSNNNLTGEVPEFLADLKSIMVIDLRGNNLSGPVPASLLQKKGLMLHLDDNPHILCTTGSCMHKGEGEKKSIIVPVVASIVSLAVIIGALILFLVFRKKKASKVEGTLPSYMQASDGRSPRSSEPAIVTKNKRFTYSQVVIMTNNFQRILGKGGFGIVYHGFVNGVEQVAVKILSHSSSQGYKQFKAEVELLLRVHHKNLVGLVGYCDEGENMALIYEYMANGDLKEHMSGTRNRFILNWETRLKIVIDSAQGLEYLHNGCKPLMVHRDVKTTNILLNEHFEAKLADFGLSRSFPIGGETHVSTVVAGTPGYLDPEYYKTNRLTEKSDVYSFGIVLLEMITNRPVIDQSREKPYISEWVGIMLTKGDIISIMDPSLNGDYDSGSVWKAVELAMSCLNPSSTRRPTMSQVLIALNECLVSENSRGGASRDMDSKSSLEVSLTFDTDVSPMAR